MHEALRFLGVACEQYTRLMPCFFRCAPGGDDNRRDLANWAAMVLEGP